MSSRPVRPRRYFPGRPPQQVESSASEDQSSADESEQGKNQSPETDQKPGTRLPPSSAGENGPVRRQRAAPVVLEPGNIEKDAANHVLASRLTGLPVSGQEKCFPYSRCSGSGDIAKHSTDGPCDRQDGADEDEDEEEEEDEGTVEDDEEDNEHEEIAPMLKPVFVPKHARATEQARRLKAEKDEAELARMEARENERIRETREYVSVVLAKEDAAVTNGGRFMEELDKLPDDEDRSEDDEVQYALWKVREMRRVLRDRNPTHPQRTRSS